MAWGRKPKPDTLVGTMNIIRNDQDGLHASFNLGDAEEKKDAKLGRDSKD